MRWKDVALSLLVSSETITSVEKDLKALKINIYEAFEIILKEWASQHGYSSYKRKKVIDILEKHGLSLESSNFIDCIQKKSCELQNQPTKNHRILLHKFQIHCYRTN